MSQFYISSIDIVDADRQLLNDLALRPGQVYNVRLVDLSRESISRYGK